MEAGRPELLGWGRGLPCRGGVSLAPGARQGPISNTPTEPSLAPRRDVIKRIDQSEFEGFEYINPLLLSTEESV